MTALTKAIEAWRGLSPGRRAEVIEDIGLTARTMGSAWAVSYGMVMDILRAAATCATCSGKGVVRRESGSIYGGTVSEPCPVCR